MTFIDLVEKLPGPVEMAQFRLHIGELKADLFMLGLSGEPFTQGLTCKSEFSLGITQLSQGKKDLSLFP